MRSQPEYTKAQADTLYKQGFKYFHTSHVMDALQCWQEALSIYTRIGQIVGRGYSLNQLGIAHLSLAHYHDAIDCFQQSLTLTEEFSDRQDAGTINNIGVVYQSMGDFKTALTYHQQALTLFKDTGNTQGQAQCLTNLGNASRALCQYNTAIDYYQQCLAVGINDKKNTAHSFVHLGSAYCSLCEYETARGYYQRALDIAKEIDDKDTLAHSFGGLGNVFESLGQYETAIDVYHQGLQIARDIGDKDNEAIILGGLGNAHFSLGQYETAIDVYHQGLQIARDIGAREIEAVTLGNLANVYIALGPHLTDAIQSGEQGLKIARRINNDGAKAHCLCSLANCYVLEEDYLSAIEYYRKALDISIAIGEKNSEAHCLGDLGNVYSTLASQHGDKEAERWLARRQYDMAIDYYRRGLEVARLIGDRQSEANMLNNLGDTYRHLQQTSRAIEAYRDALKIATPASLPVECSIAGRYLGLMAQTDGRWDLVIEAYARAIDASEVIRASALTDTRREEILSGDIDVYFGIVDAYLNIRQYDKALEYVERSKARNLVDLLVFRDLYPKGSIPQHIINDLNNIRQRMTAEQKRLERTAPSARRSLMHALYPGRTEIIAPDRTPVSQLQHRLNELITREIVPIDPGFSLTQRVHPIRFSDIQSLTGDGDAMIEWYVTRDKIITFLLTPDTPYPAVWYSSTDEARQLAEWINDYLATYSMNKEQWRAALETRLERLAAILRLDNLLYHVPIECNRLIIIPHRALHLLPLHALPVGNCIAQRGRTKAGSVNGIVPAQYRLFDVFPRGVQYGPSCQILKLVESATHDDFNSIFAIQNPIVADPTKQLLLPDLEVLAISSFFSSSKILAKQEATKDAVNKYDGLSSVHCVHFACHGEFDADDPPNSALILANGEHLALPEIFGLSLQQCRLVTLSACETGLTDYKSRSDEYIGIPSGFLFAGTRSVVSSLWTVRDLATAFLMIKFYENLRQCHQLKSGEIAVCLKRAQQWLRNITIEEVENYIEQYKPHLDRARAQWRTGQCLLFEEYVKQIRQRQPHPFANVYYWGAFTATGL